MLILVVLFFLLTIVTNLLSQFSGKILQTLRLGTRKFNLWQEGFLHLGFSISNLFNRSPIGTSTLILFVSCALMDVIPVLLLVQAILCCLITVILFGSNFYLFSTQREFLSSLSSTFLRGFITTPIINGNPELRHDHWPFLLCVSFCYWKLFVSF